MKLPIRLKAIVAEPRGAIGRLVFFSLCLVLGVAAVVAVRGAIGAVEDTLSAESRRILGADLTLRGRRPLPDDALTVFASEKGAEVATLVELTTVARAPGSDRSRTVELRAVGGGWPHYGVLRLEPAMPVEALGADGVAVAPELASALDLSVGEGLSLGGSTFTVKAIVAEEPTRLNLSLSIGPRVLMSPAGLERAGLAGEKSRVNYTAAWKLPEAKSAEAIAALEARFKDEVEEALWIRVRAHTDSQPQVTRTVERLGGFLGLVALASLVLGGLGVAQVVRTWLARTLPRTAVLRCLGMRASTIARGVLLQVFVLSLGASAVGAALGALAPRILPSVAPELFPADQSFAFPWLAAGVGMLLGVSAALIFALPPLASVWRVSPARVLRREAEPLPVPWGVRLATLGMVALGVFGAGVLQGGGVRAGGAFVAALAGVAGLLWLVASALLWLVRRLPRARLPAILAHGLGALARPGQGTLAGIVALGLGVFIVLGLWSVERQLSRGFQELIPAEAPTTFFLDIERERSEEFEALLRTHDSSNSEIAPLITARLTKIGSEGVRERLQRTQASGRDRWVLTREQRLSVRESLSPSNELLRGAPFDPEDGIAEVSVEERFADDLGVDVGSELTFDISGVPFTLRVSSIRSVAWESFELNFFLIVEPGVLDDVPSLRIAVAHLPAEREAELLQVIGRDWPQVTPIAVRPLVERVVNLITRVAAGVRWLGGFTIAVGLVILAGAVAAGALERAREAALMKALGVRRATIAALWGVEFGLGGAAAALAGGSAGLLGAAIVAREALDLPGSAAWWLLVPTVLLSAFAAALLGLLASQRALRVAPIVALREAG